MKSEQPLLAVNNLTYFCSSRKGFEQVSFELFPGEVLGIIGESGSGKNTLLQAISGHLVPQQGSIRCRGNELYALSESERCRILATHPQLVFIDRPVGGADVSEQAYLLDLLPGMVANLTMVMVTHDLGVARWLTHRLLVMKQGRVVESGLTDRVPDDPHHPYSQLLVSSWRNQQ